MLDTIKDLTTGEGKNKYASYSQLKERRSRYSLKVKIGFFLLILAGILFMPWTQNIRVPGKVTTLLPDQRPQPVPTSIDARIDKWFIKEGDLVEEGDTLVTLSEVKTEYLDSDILQRTDEQIQALEQTITAFEHKIKTLDNQLTVVRRQRDIKLNEAENKINIAKLKLEADSAALIAQNMQFAIADTQFKRIQVLYNDGLRSLSDYESRAARLQENQAKQTALRNKYQAAINELKLARIQISAIEVDFQEKLNKTITDLEETRSKLYKAQNDLAKLKNKRANIARRHQFHVVTAPQKGYITQTTQTGIGGVIKEGTQILQILPYNIQIGIEMYIKPVNMPLINVGNDVQVIFDGWPALVVSGWPATSIGSYAGKIWAIDRSPRVDGTYRILIEPAKQSEWPEFLPVGSGAEAIALFKTVPFGYEIWRTLNGFPPEFYRPTNTATQKP